MGILRKLTSHKQNLEVANHTALSKSPLVSTWEGWTLSRDRQARAEASTFEGLGFRV